MVGSTFEGEGERRHRPRVMVSLPMRMYETGRDHRLHYTRTIDLSTVGAMLHGATTLRIGQPVSVEVPRGTSRNPLRLSAEVVRVAPPQGNLRQHAVAVRFTGLNALDEAVLRAIIDDYRG